MPDPLGSWLCVIEGSQPRGAGQRGQRGNAEGPSEPRSDAQVTQAELPRICQSVRVTVGHSSSPSRPVAQSPSHCCIRMAGHGKGWLVGWPVWIHSNHDGLLALRRENKLISRQTGPASERATGEGDLTYLFLLFGEGARQGPHPHPSDQAHQAHHSQPTTPQGHIPLSRWSCPIGTSYCTPCAPSPGPSVFSVSSITRYLHRRCVVACDNAITGS